MSEWFNNSVLVVDSGWYCEVAARLAEEFDTVFYWSPWQGDFPYAADVAPGSGLEGVERVERLHDYLPLADLVVFPADGYEDLQAALRRDGRRVWGAGDGFELEHNRFKLKAYLQNHGLPVIEDVSIQGVSELYNVLHKAEYEGWYIKLNRGYRGDMETFHHENWQRSRSWFYDTARRLGPMGDYTVWMLEPPVDGFEGGGDLYTSRGQYPGKVLIGYEIKDSCYVSTVKDYSILSPALRAGFDALVEWWAQTGACTLFSTEVRITEEGIAYFIDLAARTPWPPGATWLTNCLNLGEIMWYGAEGFCAEAKWEYKFAVELLIEAPWTLGKGDWLAVEMPESVRPYAKLHSVAKFGDTYWLRPQPSKDQGGSVGSVVAASNDFNTAVELCRKRVKLVEAQGLVYDDSHIQKAEKEIAKGEKAGIKWW